MRLFGDVPEERAVIHRVISEFDSYSRHHVNKTERALFSGTERHRRSLGQGRAENLGCLCRTDESWQPSGS